MPANLPLPCDRLVLPSPIKGVLIPAGQSTNPVIPFSVGSPDVIDDHTSEFGASTRHR